LLHKPAKEVNQALERVYLSAPVATSVNGYLVTTGDKLVLIDAGAGSLFGTSLGNLADNLKAAGYRPEQVDEIYLTHMHPDHLGGLASDGERVFPNATVRADQADTQYWLDKQRLANAPESQKAFFKGAIASMKPYQQADALQTFEGTTELPTGVTAQAAPGHTPGHTTYAIESQGERLVFWGDLIHAADIQFDEPGVTIDFDATPDRAAQARKAACAEAADQGYQVAGAHLSFPGIGRLRQDGEGYEWLPLNYSP